MPNDVVIDVVVNADQAIATMQQVGQQQEKIAATVPNDVVIDVVVNADQAIATMEQVGQQQEKVAATVEVSSAQFRQAGLALGRFGQAMTNILVLSNLLPGSLGNAVNKTLLLATATINAVYAVSQLVKIYQELAKAQRIQIALQSILAALSGIGIARVALAAGVGVAAYSATTALMNRGEGGGNRGEGGGNRGEGGGNRGEGGGNRGEGGGKGGNIYNFNGPVLGTEAELARKLTELQRENNRLGR